MTRDHTDRLIDEWARIRREVLGIKQPLLAKDYLGAPRCTLSSRRDLHAGASSSGRIEQHWPELYVGNSAIVNWLFWRANPSIKEIMDWHWTLEKPRNKGIRAELMGLSRRVYWERVNRARHYVEGGLALVESVRTLQPEKSGSFGIRVSVRIVDTPPNP